MIRCRVARARVQEALERELGLEERFQLEEHTAGCAACAEHERRTRLLQELLEGPGDPVPTVPALDAAARAVFAALDRGDGLPWKPRRRRRALLLTLCALVVGGLSVLHLVLRAPSSGPVPSPVPGSLSADWNATAVEVTVRAALLDSFPASAADAAADDARADIPALERFLAATREPARSGWPVRRFVEGLLESPDLAIARRAARCLAALGDASAAPALERALDRAGLEADALAALAELGPSAVGALERALGRPTLAAPALRELCRVGGERGALAIERAARRAQPDSIPSREALLDALTTTGTSAVASLVRLAEEREGERQECGAILARLPLVADAGPELARLLAHEHLASDLAYRALALLQPPEALPWLEERCGTYRERSPALETLATFGGSAVLGSVLRLSAGGRVPREDVVRLLEDLLERDAGRAEPFTSELMGRPDTGSMHAWLALLIESEHPGAAPSLVRLAFCETLPEDDRQWAALAVGELGTPADAASMIAELAGHLSADRRRTAACLLSIHGLLGDDGVEQALTPCSSAGVRRVLQSLAEDGRAGAAIQLHRVARALDGALAESASATSNRKEIL